MGAQDDNTSGPDVAEGVEPDYHRTDAPYEIGGAVQFYAGPCVDGEGQCEAASRQAAGNVARIEENDGAALQCSQGLSWGV